MINHESIVSVGQSCGAGESSARQSFLIVGANTIPPHVDACRVSYCPACLESSPCRDMVSRDCAVTERVPGFRPGQLTKTIHFHVCVCGSAGNVPRRQVL
jgi:hypothetical protein